MKVYVDVCMKKFTFYLDPLETGQVFIKNILVSPILAEFYEMRNESLTKEDLINNWFSI
jgi:serine/threonine-protein phosphatase 2A regulatory subunit B''